VNPGPSIGTLVVWHGVIQGIHYLGMITEVGFGYTTDMGEGHSVTRVRVRWADDRLAPIGEWYRDELGIIVARQSIQFSDEIYIVVHWTTGKRGFWRTDGAKKYLIVVG